MKLFSTIAYFFGVSALLCSCASTPEPVDNSATEQTTHTIQIEPQKGRLNVETSIARTLNYNLETVKKQITPKFLGTEAHQNAFANLRKLREGHNPNLATSLKELDFAILYTAININSHPDKIDNLLNQATAQNLTLAAIKAHKDTLFGHKKTFELHRQIRQYQKQIAEIIKKKDETSLEYKTKLENSIDKINVYLKTIEQNIADFKQLVKIDKAKIELEGRGFFDKQILPPQSKIEPYQQAAFSNRLELTDFQQNTLESIAKKITEQYPDNHSEVKGFYVHDTVYQKNLTARGDAQANTLLQTMLTYQKATTHKQQKLFPKLSEEFYKALYLQVELAYQLAAKTSADYQIQQTNIKEINQHIHSLKKTSRPTLQQRLELLQTKLDLLENEILADQILGERTMAVTSLYFYTGQIYITPETLKQNIQKTTAFISASLQKKLSQKNTFHTPSEIEESLFYQESNDWAHKEDWLEKLMAETPKANNQRLNDKPVSGRLDFNRKTVLQMGAFLDKNAALIEWEKILKDFPELKKHQPLYEQTTVAGIPIYRLLIKSPQGGFKEICIRLRKQNHECFLRD